MPLQKNVIDRDAADDVAVLCAIVDVVLVRKAMKMLKQCFVVLRQHSLGEKGCMCSFIVVENAQGKAFNVM